MIKARDIYDQKLALAEAYNVADVVDFITRKSDVVAYDNMDTTIYLKCDNIEECISAFKKSMMEMYPEISHIDFIFNTLPISEQECIISF